MIHVLCKAADGRDMEVSRFVEHKHKHGLSLEVIWLHTSLFCGGELEAGDLIYSRFVGFISRPTSNQQCAS